MRIRGLPLTVPEAEGAVLRLREKRKHARGARRRAFDAELARFERLLGWLRGELPATDYSKQREPLADRLGSDFAANSCGAESLPPSGRSAA